MDRATFRRLSPDRRTFLGALGGLATASPLIGETDVSPAVQETRTLMAGTDQETTLYVNDSGQPGITAYVVGGIHGDEEAGYLAADGIADWLPDAGTLVVLPRANSYAIARDQREGPNGDLNRRFPLRAQPETELARQIWGIVTEFTPDVVIDLHESRGLYPDSGIGQSLGYSPVGSVRNAADVAIRDVNGAIRTDADEFRPRFLPSPEEYPSGVFVQKTAFERGIPSYIVETYEQLDRADRVRWHRQLVKRVFAFRTDVADRPDPRHTLKVVGSGPTTSFEVDVSGQVYRTDELETNDTVGESHAEGTVTTLGDYVQYTGRVESFSVTEGSAADITIYVDGVETTIDELTPTDESTLDIVGGGTEVEYQLGVDEAFTGATTDDSDWVFDDRAYGTVSSGTDSYRYSRDVARFAVTHGDPADLTLRVDGEETTADALATTPTHELHVAGTGPTVRFQFAVSGAVDGTDTLEDTDVVGASAVEGQVSTQDDYYQYTGDILSFRVIEGSAADLDLLVDGMRTSVDELNAADVHQLRVAGTGPETRFQVDVSGLSYPTATLEDSDGVGVSRILGQVSVGSDRYLYTGDVDAFTVTQGRAADIEVAVDGEPTTVAELNGEEADGTTLRTLQVSGTGPVTRFTFAADEQVEPVAETMEDTDTVYAQSAAGQVSTLDDRYRFGAELLSFRVTEGRAADLDLYVDGEAVSVADLNPDRISELRVEGTGPTVRFDVETNGATYPTATLEDSDTVYDARIEGQVSTLDDRYLFEGDITSFDVTYGSAADINLYVDGEPTTVAELNGEEETGSTLQTLEVSGTGPETQFTFAADERVEPVTETMEDTDTVYAQSAAGQVSTLSDRYQFASELISFRVTDGSAADLDLAVDGTPVTVADLNPDRISELRVEGTGPTVRFTVETNGATYPTATLEDSDTVYDARIEGQVSTLDDRYLFEGDITSFDVTYGSAEDITVYVDGEQRSIATLNG